MRDITRSEWPICAWLILGCTTTNLMFYLVGFSVPFQSIDNLGIGGFGFARYGFFISCVLCALLLASFAKKVEHFETHFNIAVPLLTLIGILFYGIAGHQRLDIAGLSAAIGSLCVGLGYIWYNMRLYHAIASIKAFTAIIAILTCSISLTIILFALILTFIPAMGHLFVAAALSLISALSINRATRIYIKENQLLPLSFANNNHEALLKTKASRNKQLGQLALVSVVLIVMRGLMDSGIWGSTLTPSANPASVPWALIIVSIFIIISVPTFLLYIKNSKGYHYHLPFLVLIAGFFVILLMKEQANGGQALWVFTSSIELLCQMLFSFTLVKSARLLNISGFRLTGYTLAFTYMIVIFWTTFMEDTEFTSSAIILIIAYFLTVFIGTPSLPYEPKAKQENVVSTHKSVAAESQRIAEENGLTNRETEILALLLQGRSLPYIQRELVLAEGTVKTHVGHIYKKLGVHSKQELIDLLTANIEVTSHRDQKSQ